MGRWSVLGPPDELCVCGHLHSEHHRGPHHSNEACGFMVGRGAQWAKVRCTCPVFTAKPPVEGPGYHVTAISRGELGELSKLQEELDELKDAEAQGIKVMQLVEASDLVGALVRWLERHHPGTTLDDLISMHKVTRRAFENGHRKDRGKK